MRRVTFRLAARRQLDEIRDYIAARASSKTANNFTDAIVACCQSLGSFPIRGTPRDDIRPGMRTIGFRRRVLISFVVKPDKVVIVAILYGGRNADDWLS